jgi:hypothetical protein
MIHIKRAPEGKFLTRSGDVRLKDRVLAKSVCSASEDVDSEWRIASDEEVAEVIARESQEEERI